jgi:diacylglycerol kinase (CTP)
MDSLMRRVERQTPFNVKRALVHFATGFAISIAGLLLSHYLLMYMLVSLAAIWLLVDLFRMQVARFGDLFNSYFAPFLRDYEKSRLTGASFLLVGSLVSFLVFENQIAALSVSFLAVGDPLAHLVRDRLNRSNTVVRFLAETLACLAGCVVVGLLLVHYGNLSVNPIYMFAAAVVGAIVQGLSLPIDDNLTMPLCAGATIWITRTLFG